MPATKQNIITLPNSHLRERSKKIGIITKSIKDLVNDMTAAVLDWDASRKHEVTVALAAVQIDKPYRVVIIRNDFNHETPAAYSTLVNPEITKYEGKKVKDYEGCLSIKSVYGHVPRYEKVRVRALDINGKAVNIKADGFLARVLQHEIDHTKGTMFIDHIKEDKKAFYRLDDNGKLVPLDYDKEVKDNNSLWPK